MMQCFSTREKLFLLICFSAISAQPVKSATIVSQPPLAGGESFLSEPEGEQSADAFFMAADTRITSLRWWGVYISSAPEPDNFIVRFFESENSLPKLNPNFQFSSLSVSRIDSGITDSFGDTVYEYQAQLPQSVIFESQTDAFVSVVNSTADGWFWTKSDNTGSNWFRLDDQDSWLAGSGEVSGNLAFKLSGLIPPGDFDDNNHVNGADFLSWQNGDSPLSISATDLTEWQSFYGMSAPLTKAVHQAVPEPSSILLLVTSFILRPIRSWTAPLCTFRTTKQRGLSKWACNRRE